MGVGQGVYAERISRLEFSSAHLVVSLGFCGALDPSLRIGAVLKVSDFAEKDIFGRPSAEARAERSGRPASVLGGLTAEVLDSGMTAPNSAFSHSEISVGGLLTVASVVAEAADKDRIKSIYPSALGVDMESVFFARKVRDSRVGALLLRSVSDESDQSFPIPANLMYCEGSQKTNLLPLIAWLLRHPSSARGFCSFVRGSFSARKSLNLVAIREVAKALGLR